MNAILKFDFQIREQLRFSEVNYLNYTKKDLLLHVAAIFSLKQGETRTSHGPIPHPLSTNNQYCFKLSRYISLQNSDARPASTAGPRMPKAIPCVGTAYA